ncbi:aminoglycoside adenylyltransferase domain-containing protein [Nocardioides sp. P5_C9_2]
MEPVVAELHRRIVRDAPGDPVALYLTGSYCDGGLRPDSDLDVLLVTRRSLGTDERRHLVDDLLRCSGRRATVRPGRPIELTSLVLDDIEPWRYPATCDFLYGEWLRDDYEAGALPGREIDPNLPVLLTSARQHSVVLCGPALDGLIDPVPTADLRRSQLDALPELLDDLVGDERNVLLTLARMLHTLQTGRIVAKDEAASHVVPALTSGQAETLRLAARAYRGEVLDDWSDRRHEAAAVAEALAHRVRELPR